MVRKTKSKAQVGVPAESVLVAPVTRKPRKKSKPPPEPVLQRAKSPPVAVHAESVLRAPVYKKKKVPSAYCEWVRREYHTTTHLPVRDRLRDLGKRWQELKKKSA
jgi:hypothetical protein